MWLQDFWPLTLTLTSLGKSLPLVGKEASRGCRAEGSRFEVSLKVPASEEALTAEPIRRQVRQGQFC